VFFLSCEFEDRFPNLHYQANLMRWRDQAVFDWLGFWTQNYKLLSLVWCTDGPLTAALVWLWVYLSCCVSSQDLYLHLELSHDHDHACNSILVSAFMTQLCRMVPSQLAIKSTHLNRKRQEQLWVWACTERRLHVRCPAFFLCLISIEIKLAKTVSPANRWKASLNAAGEAQILLAASS